MLRLAAVPLTAVALDRHGRRRWPTAPYDLVIVPGARVYPDGTPSQALIRRVHLGLALLRAGLGGRILMSGRGRGGRPEAEVMAELAAKHGVDAEVEAASMTTAENAALCARGWPAERVLVATDIAHVKRCEAMFGRFYAEARGVGAPAGVRSRVKLALREAVRSAVL